MIGWETQAHFWSQVDVRSPAECWNWLGATTHPGTNRNNRSGLFRGPNGERHAYRIAYMMARGGIATGLVVMHSCDNRLCVNPAHLSVGTQHENVLDMHRKGRGHGRVIGGGPPAVRLARALADGPKTVRELASATDTHHDQVRRDLNRHRDKFVNSSPDATIGLWTLRW